MQLAGTNTHRRMLEDRVLLANEKRDALLATAFDLKMPPHFTDAEMDKLADVLVQSRRAPA